MLQNYTGALFANNHYINGIATKALPKPKSSTESTSNIQHLIDDLRRQFGKDFLTVKDIAGYMGVSIERARKLVRYTLPSKKLGRTYYVHITNYAKWIQEDNNNGKE